MTETLVLRLERCCCRAWYRETGSNEHVVCTDRVEAYFTRHAGRFSIPLRIELIISQVPLRLSDVKLEEAPFQPSTSIRWFELTEELELRRNDPVWWGIRNRDA